MALAASSAAAALRSTTATFAPLAASAVAVARPSPEPPPVTIAAMPERFIGSHSSLMGAEPLPTGEGARQPVAPGFDPAQPVKARRSSECVAAFRRTGIERMTNFSSSTTRKKTTPPPISQGQTQSGSDSLPKIMWNGGA